MSEASSTDAEREALVRSISDIPILCGWKAGWLRALAEGIIGSDWLRDHDAALTAKAKAEGAREALREAATGLREYASQEFDLKGPHDPRGAAIWDSAAHITERADRMTP